MKLATNAILTAVAFLGCASKFAFAVDTSARGSTKTSVDTAILDETKLLEDAFAKTYTKTQDQTGSVDVSPDTDTHVAVPLGMSPHQVWEKKTCKCFNKSGHPVFAHASHCKIIFEDAPADVLAAYSASVPLTNSIIKVSYNSDSDSDFSKDEQHISEQCLIKAYHQSHEDGSMLDLAGAKFEGQSHHNPPDDNNNNLSIGAYNRNWAQYFPMWGCSCSLSEMESLIAAFQMDSVVQVKSEGNKEEEDEAVTVGMSPHQVWEKKTCKCFNKSGHPVFAHASHCKIIFEDAPADALVANSASVPLTNSIIKVSYNSDSDSDFSKDEQHISEQCLIKAFHQSHEDGSMLDLAGAKFEGQSHHNPPDDNNNNNLSLGAYNRNWAQYFPMWGCSCSLSEMESLIAAIQMDFVVQVKAEDNKEEEDEAVTVGVSPHQVWEKKTCKCFNKSGHPVFAHASDCKIIFEDVPADALAAHATYVPLTNSIIKVSYSSDSDSDFSKDEQHISEQCLIKAYHQSHEDGSMLDLSGAKFEGQSHHNPPDDNNNSLSLGAYDRNWAQYFPMWYCPSCSLSAMESLIAAIQMDSEASPSVPIVPFDQMTDLDSQLSVISAKFVTSNLREHTAEEGGFLLEGLLASFHKSHQGSDAFDLSNATLDGETFVEPVSVVGASLRAGVATFSWDVTIYPTWHCGNDDGACPLATLESLVFSHELDDDDTATNKSPHQAWENEFCKELQTGPYDVFNDIRECQIAMETLTASAFVEE